MRRLTSFGWALAPMLLGIPAAFSFGWAARRLRSKELAVEAGLYGGLTVTFFVLSGQPNVSSDISGAVGLTLMTVATARGLMIRRRVFFPAQRVPPPPLPATPTDWTPVFPASTAPPPDPRDPATWRTPFTCTGQDKHRLTMPVAGTTGLVVLGLALITIDVRLHVTGRGLGTAIGLMLAPLFVAMFSRWVEGPVLYYRTWGVEHSIRLDAVTGVDVAKGSAATTLMLSSAGLAKPVRVTLRARGFAVSPAARAHLRGWLERPGVQMSPEARLLLQTSELAVGATRRRRTRRALIVARVLGGALPLAAVVAVLLLASGVGAAHRAIRGAPGYYTASGPHGNPFPTGRPWGTPCQPLRFVAVSALPEAVYRQLSTVVAEARADGMNVTLEDRQFRWQPGTLRYPPGTTAADVPRVPVFFDDEPPPHFSDGSPRHMEIGWDTRSDGSHEDLTYVKGHLHLAAFGADPATERTALRQLVAFTQGVYRTTRADSGIRTGTTVDRFSRADVHAMRVMSGCQA